MMRGSRRGCQGGEGGEPCKNADAMRPPAESTSPGALSPEPSLGAEFRRGLDPYNLSVGAGAAVALGAAVLAGTAAGVVPDILGTGAAGQGLAAALGLFVTITGLHTGAHAYVGWRLGRGLRAHRAGDHRRALSLLRVVEGRGMSHYDPGGHARRALAESRAALTARSR
jgi:hypothetical protein